MKLNSLFGLDEQTYIYSYMLYRVRHKNGPKSIKEVMEFWNHKIKKRTAKQIYCLAVEMSKFQPEQIREAIDYVSKAFEENKQFVLGLEVD